MTKTQHRLLCLFLSVNAMAPALAAQRATAQQLASQIGKVIRERLDAYGRADAAGWARYVAPDCLCGTGSRDDLQHEIAARNAGIRIWYGDVGALKVQQHGDTVVARYRATEHTEIAGQRLATETWRTETFLRRGTGWILIAVSDTPIPADPPIAGSPVQSRDEVDRAKLIGTWRLVTYEDRPDQGPLRLPYGPSPRGVLMYDRTGHMSIQIMKTPHPKVASGDDEKITAEEKIALFDAYTAYFGTYRVDAARGAVVNHVEGDLADVFIGRDEERPYELTGDRLTLKTQWETGGQRWHGLRVFERIK